MLRYAIEGLTPAADAGVPQQTALQAELGIPDQELARLTAAVAQGGDLGTLLGGIRAREQRRRTLQQELAGLQALKPLTAADLGHLQREVEVRVADWRGVLTRQVTQSRQILKKVLVGRIAFRRREDGSYEFSGQATLGKLLAGIVCTKAGVSPTGPDGLCTVQTRREIRWGRAA